MKKAKTYTISEYSLRAALKMAGRAHTRSIGHRRAKKAAEVGSYKRESERMDEAREWYYARGMMMALSFLEGTAANTRRRNPRPAPKSTPTAKATA